MTDYLKRYVLLYLIAVAGFTYCALNWGPWSRKQSPSAVNNPVSERKNYVGWKCQKSEGCTNEDLDAAIRSMRAGSAKRGAK